MARQEWLLSFCNPWLVLGLLSILSANHVECLCLAKESRALLALKAKNPSDALSSWKKGSDCCHEWAGVTCDADESHVMALNLTGRLQLLLNFSIPDDVCSLNELQIFNISVMIDVVSEVNGDIPSCLWNMSQLRFLIFSATTAPDSLYDTTAVSVQGSLPAQVCSLKHLTHLDISGIYFASEQVPHCLWDMTLLEHLALPSWDPESTLLASRVCNLGNLTHLELDVTPNTIVDMSIPSCIWKMTRLKYLSLNGFLNRSSMSSHACSMGSLAYLKLTDSPLHGDIPSCIWNLTKLKHLSWDMNGDASTQSYPVPLSMSFSSDICNLRSLSYLSIGLSAVQGNIPTCLWNLTKLEVLEIKPFSWVPSLPLPGTFSLEVCGWTELSRLTLPYLDITGVLPGCIWRMTHLEYLDLSGSDLSRMEHPREVSAPSLTHLVLHSTNIGAAFLDTAGKLASLSELDLSGNNFVTLDLGNSMSNLSQLGSLSASSNFIRKVPAWIANCSQLSSLILSDNSILDISSSPFNWSMLSNLVSKIDLSSNLLRQVSMSDLDNDGTFVLLDLSSNKIERISLTGSIGLQLLLSENFLEDTELDLHLPALSILTLASNRIRRIPQSLFNMSQLSDLDLSNNPLHDISGLCHMGELFTLSLSNISIPTWTTGLETLCIRNFSQLSSLDISSNNISGDLATVISSSIRNLTYLQELYISNNNISGDLSVFSSVDLTLQVLDVSKNQLTGELPKSLVSFVSTSSTHGAAIPGVTLNVSGNYLMGRVPEPQGDCCRVLDLSRNNFTGPIPSLSKSLMTALVLSQNNFTGVIPTNLWNYIQTLDLSFNRLSGRIPDYLGTFPFLTVLDLTSNDLHGSIPEALGNCVLLQHLRLKNNSLRGQIPSSIGRFGQTPALQSLTISYNHIEGAIPPSLGNCVGLQLLDLSHNNLHGTLPSTLENLSASLRVLTVASNRLSGLFPAWIVSANFSSLQVLDLSYNSFDGDLPANFSRLSGFINGTNSNNNDTLYDDGVEVFAMGSVEVIAYFVSVRTSFDMSSNLFSGSIPERLSELRALRYLTLSGNTFSGEIPARLSNLEQLESLDLSKNFLSGTIPADLVTVPRLAFFNVSDNFLSGAIPKGGQFNTFTPASFQNNSALCGFPLSPCKPLSPPGSPKKSPTPAHRHSEKQEFSRWISSAAVLAGFGTGFGTVGLTFLVSGKARNLLYTPRKKRKVIYDYWKPYGAYVPRT